MIKKLTKFGRSTLSVILCLTMLLTTFCFFDIGSVISNAMVTVTENNKMKGSLSSQFMYAPEIAYLKPGSSAFQYFSNYDPATGKAISTNDATSRLEFDYKGATEIAIGVNRVYYKNGENDVDFSGTLKINNVTVTQNKVAYNATTSTSFSSIASSASGAISVTLNANQCSLTGAATGTTYYIQWVFRYKVDGAYHFAFMYTGVYVPLLDQAGTSTSQRYIKSGSNPTENHSWSFITGAMKYSGGNRKSQFLGTTANKLMAAPLVSFVGRAQNENNYTIPGGDGQALNENNFSSSQTPYNTFVYNRGSRGKNELFYDTTSISVPLSYSGTVTGNVSITNTGDGVIGSGITLGMAYIVVDTSRYTNYNQIPYLSAGYAQFYHDLDGNGNKLNSIKSVKRYDKGSSTSIAYDGTIYCDVDTSNYTDHDSYSVARGLYKFNGSIIAGLVTFDTWFYNGYKHVLGYTESIGVHHYNGLYTEKVDKQTLRTVYNDASHSHIDYKTYSSGYSAYYTELKSVAETLCNPQLYSKKTTSLSGTASGSVKAIETSIVNSTTTTDNYVYFYVPEVIYLTPGKATFQYYSDMSAVSLSNGVCTPTVNSANNDATGNIYFYYKNASKVKITQSGASSVSLSGGNVTSFNSYVNTSQSAVTTANISGGSVSEAKSSYIKWTATYVEDNIEKTVTAKSYVYSPYVGSVAAAALGRDSSGECESATSIIWGIHGLKENVYKNMNIYYATNSNTTSDHSNTKNGYGGGYNPKPILTKPTYDTNGTGYRWFNRTDPYNNKKVYSTASGFDGMSYVYRDSGNGGMVAVSGIGSLYVDTSRFSNFGQIPNFAMFTNHDSDSNMCRYAEIMTKSVNSRTSGSAIKQTVVKGDKTTYSSTKPQAYNISGTDLSSFSTSGVASFILYAYTNNKDDKGEWTNAYSAVDVSASDRSGLRKAVEYAAKYSYALQAEYFNNTDTSTDYRWTAYVNALSNAQDALTKVDGTADFGTYNVDSTKRSGLAKTLMDAVDVLLNSNRGTAPRNTSNYTATQKNVGLVANSNGTFTVAAIAEAASEGTASISKTFKAYDKVEFSAEQYEGYKYVGYIKGGASSNGDAFSATDYNNMVNSTDPVSKSKNETLTFGNAKNVNYSYTFYYILNPDVLFDNEFDFDQWALKATFSGAHSFNMATNTATITNPGTSTDYSTSNINGTGSYYMNVLPNHTYRISMKVKMGSTSGTVDYMAFAFRDANRTNPSVGTSPYYSRPSISLAANAEGTLTSEFKIPSDASYMTLRLGLRTASITASFSDIYIQDITTPGGFKDDVTDATPHANLSLISGSQIGNVASISRTGYAFDGWYNNQDSTGNGTGTKYTSTSTVGNSNLRLYAKWTVAPELMFDNEFRFDNITASDIASGANNSTYDIDYGSNKLRLNAKGSDAYTGQWYGIKSGAFAVTPGHTYRIRTTVKNTSSSAKYAAVYIFCFADSNLNSTDTDGNRKSAGVTVASGAESIIDFNYTVQTGRYYGALRFGINDSANGDTAEFSNIYVQDTTSPGGVADDVTPADPINKVKLPGESVGSLADIERSGYTFTGWNTAKNGTGTTYTESTKMPSSNTQLWSQWDVNSYTITFAPNGGSVTPTSKTFTINDSISLPTPTRTGYTFAGWKVTTAGGNWKTTDSVYKGTVAAGKYGNVTLTAQWTANVYTITFLPNGGSVNPTSKTFTIESTIELPTPTKDSYVFDGWLVTTAEGNWTNGTLYTDSSIPAGKYGNVTVTAQWHKTVTVHFYSGSKGAVHNQFQITFKNNETAGSVKSPASFGTIDGWTALGWTASTAASKAVGDAAIKGGTTITVAPAKNEYVYYAVYTQSQTLKYESNASGDTSVKNIPANGTLAGAYYNSSDAKLNITRTIPSTVPTRNGYTFKSWNTQANGSGTNYAAGARYTNSAQIDTLYAQWTENQYTITYVNGNGNADSKVGYKITSEITIIAAPTYDGYVFVGWKVTTVTNGNWTSGDLYGAGAKIGSGKYGNVTLVAQWVYVKDAETKADEYNQDNTISIVTGVDGNGNTTSITTTKYDAESFKKYQDAINAYNNAKKSIPTDINASNYSAKLSTATKNLQDAINALVNITLTERGVVTDYLNNFLIDSSGTRHNLNEMNLNHYDLATTVETAKNALVNGNAIKAKSYGITAKDTDGKTFQTKINEYVAAMAKAFKTKTQVKTEGPGFKVYENADAAKAVTDANGKTLAGATAVNYAYAGKGNYTYYCYTNSTNPTVLITVDDIANAGRVCYPTTAKATAAPTLSGSAKNANAAYTITKIPAGNADNDYLTYTKLSIGGASSYYQQKQVITLTPEFTSGTNGTVTYEFTATDDALTPNVATQSALSSGIGDANSWQKNLADDTTNTKKITIVVDYHSGDQMTVTGDQVNRDTYLNQYHLFRQSGGASNWELPKTGDRVYKVNDTTYGQTDRGSFTFTYELGATDIGNGKINTTDVNEIIKLFKDESNYSAAKKLSFVGTKYWTKNSNGTRVQHEGSGLGYQVWGNNWSFNYYPKSESYTYVHLVDRWGNAVDKVFYVGKQDIKEVTVTTASADGAYTILEDGGSGIDTLSLNAGTLEILTDENSTLENNVYRTTGNTVRIKTGEANKSYTLSMKDKATNASTATLESDGNGIITLSIDDAMYKSGVYTFMLNGTEINLYDGVNNDKYILNVYDGEAEEGEAAEMIVITTGEVGKTRFTDTDGNTVTVAASETNEDGTKTWRMSKSRPAGEYEYRISVKVGHDWIEENSTGKLIFTEKQLDTGRIVKAEYDEESGLYKLTIEGRATKIQFITEDGMTRTYTRYSEAVKSRKSYDAEGNEVPDTGRLLNHEVWLVNARLYSGQNYTVAGKFEAGWNREGTATLTGH